MFASRPSEPAETAPDRPRFPQVAATGESAGDRGAIGGRVDVQL